MPASGIPRYRRLPSILTKAGALPAAHPVDGDAIEPGRIYVLPNHRHMPLEGTAGLWTIKLRGGTAVVQEPSDALIRSMPLNALDNVAVDHRLPANGIGALLGHLARQENQARGPQSGSTIQAE